MALYSSRLRRSLSLSSPLIHCSRNLHLESSGRISTLLFNPSLSSNLEADARKSIRPFNSHLQCFRFFVSSPVALSTRRQYQGPNDDQEIGPDTILFEGCDYNHWLITIDFPKDEQISAEQMVETYVRTAAKVFGSVEEAKKRIYACSTTTYHGFQVECSEETSQKFAGLPGVVFVLPDSYIDPVNKEYGGDKYIDGTIIPRPPPIQYNNRPSRRNQGYGDGGQMQRGTRNFDRPPRDNYDARQGPPSQPNYGPPQGPPTRQNYGPPPHSSPTPQSYGPPQGPSQQYYGQSQGPPSQQSHGLPQDRPSQQNYGPPQGPPSQQNYGPPHQVPPSQQNYGPPPRVPQSQQNYDPPSRVPLSQQNYGPQPPVPTSQQNYGPPPQGPQSQQRYGPPPPQGPQSQQRYSPPPLQGPPHQQNFGLHASPPQPNNENPLRQQNYSMQQAPARQNYAHTQDLPHQQNFGRQQNYVPEPQSYGLEQNVPTAASGGWDRLDGGRRDFHHVDNGYPGQRHFEDQTQSSLSTQGGNFNPGLDGTQRQEAGTLYNKSYAREGIDSRFSQSEPRNNIHAGVQVADQVGTGLP